jgi:hypothetical protein
MPPKVVFDKTAFVKFKISNNLTQNIDETDSNNKKFIGKSIPAYGFKKSQEKKSANQKSQDFCQIFVICNKKILRLGNGFKIYRKSIG